MASARAAADRYRYGLAGEPAESVVALILDVFILFSQFSGIDRDRDR
jgi:hypothetical protein